MRKALRYILLGKAQADDLVDPRMKDTEDEFKDQAKGLYKEFASSPERAQSDTLAGMDGFIRRKRSYIPLG